MIHPQNKLFWRTASWDLPSRLPQMQVRSFFPLSSFSPALPSATCFGQSNMSRSDLCHF